MDPFLIGAIGGTANSLFNLVTSGIQQKTNNHYSRELMRFQTQLQHDENQYWADYNTPANQMARLEAAGLNPNLVYGNGADAQYSGSVNPSAQSEMQPIKVDFLALANMAAQNQNLKKQNEVLEAQKSKTDEEASHEHWKALNEKFEYEKRQGRGGAAYQGWLENKQAIANYKNTLTDTESKSFDVLVKKTQSAILDIEHGIKYQYGSLLQEATLNGLLAENAMKEINLDFLRSHLKNELKKDEATIDKLIAEASATAALKALYNAQKSLYGQQAENYRIQNEILDRERGLAEMGIYKDAPWYINLVSSLKQAFKNGKLGKAVVDGDKWNESGSRFGKSQH